VEAEVLREDLEDVRDARLARDAVEDRVSHEPTLRAIPSSGTHEEASR